MALKISAHETDGATVLALDGRVILGEETNSLRQKVKTLLADGKKKIVLNMERATQLDSVGLGTLVGLQASAKAHGASVHLSNLGPRLKEILQVTKLLTVFEVFGTEVEAVRSFSK